ncbi:MAG: 2-oxoglutarate dehydrogenase E1 component [Anaerolineae bacterium]|nr:2-oxoglutarate dehydrogenase E1 component [Anaerolineae bacterium]
MSFWRDFPGPNAAYILDLYERYRQDPASVDADTRRAFERWAPPVDGAARRDGALAPEGVALDQAVGVANLANAIRTYGHLAAQLDPLGSEPLGDPMLSLDAHGLTEDALRALPASLVSGPAAENAANAHEAILALRRIYSSTIGYDTNDIRIWEERDWLREAIESRRYSVERQPINPAAMLDRLTQVEVFEQFLHRIFPGKHRFSIEGLDIMIPMIDELLCVAAEAGTRRISIGMAHRGRLNVLAHILNKPYAQILAEFKDPVQGRHFREDLGWTGDVKYHLGGERSPQSGAECDLAVTMAPNPSHLEAVNPVVLGMARAGGTDASQPGEPRFDPSLTLPLLIHGDAAFPGQGVVAETLNLSRLPGYWTGGAIHIIANNQLGYTTLPEDARSTYHASSLAKGFKMPIVHVNADAPEACIEVIRLAAAYRARFRKDFVIDLIGYRRYGHNEGDEPSFTQPLMYETIRRHPTVRELWADTLAERGIIGVEEAAERVRQGMAALQEVYDALDPEAALQEPYPRLAPPGTARRVNTTFALDDLHALNESLLTLPDGFALHPKLVRMMDRRREALHADDEPVVDWATAEELALGTILAGGVPIRFTGEDTERGTFNQRHAVFHDINTGATYTPLQAIPQAKAAFEIHNSPLSENAVLGYEYGYNIQEPGRLVLWEAQYGDFINAAQVVVDEFITSARAKWGQTPSLVLLLPHGYEGAGPDHSSARLERFLTLSAENNLRVANPTTPAQFYHLLRRQALLLETDPLPLVVMTPKSLLRHPLVASTMRELAEGRWHPVLADPRTDDDPAAIRRLFLCSGKVYIDLISSEQRAQHPEVAIVRVEQLAPFPADDLAPVLARLPALEEVVWVQEEPQNMGAWDFVAPHLRALSANRWPLRYVGRAASSSPAEGSAAWHAANQALLLRQAYDTGPDEIADDFIIS